MTSPPNATPFCTVIIPCYNKGDYIAQAIESVLVQAEHYIQILVLDDGSTDHSFAEASRVAASDARVRVWTRPNQGPVATVNELCSHVSSPFVALLDGDDWWHRHRFAWAMEDFAKDDSLVASFCGMATVDAAGTDIGPNHCHEKDRVGADLVRQLIVANCVPASSAVIRTSVLNHLDGPFRDCSEIYDWDLWLRLAFLGPLKLHAGIGISYRKHAGNRSVLNLELLAKQELETQLELAPLLKDKYDLGNEVDALLHGSMGRRYYVTKQYAKAAHHYAHKAAQSALERPEAEQLADSLLRCNHIRQARVVMRSLAESPVM